MMIEIEIIQDGKVMKDPESFLGEQMVIPYDPLGLYSLSSPYFVLGILNFLRKRDIIEDYNILADESKFPDIEFEPNTIY